MLSMVLRMFPNCTWAAGYKWGTTGGFPNTLDYSIPNIAIFCGPGPLAARVAVAEQFNIAGQNWTNYPYLSDVGRPDESLIHHTLLLKMPPPDPEGWDEVSLADVCYTANSLPIDPKMMADTFARKLCIAVLDSLSHYEPYRRNQPLITLYATLTGEKVNSENFVPLINNNFVFFPGCVHNIFNMEVNESGKIDESNLYQGRGGGVLSGVLSGFLKEIGNIGGIAGRVLTSAFGSTQHTIPGASLLLGGMHNSKANVYNPWYRIIKHGVGSVQPKSLVYRD
jgi:hypothetical protein